MITTLYNSAMVTLLYVQEFYYRIKYVLSYDGKRKLQVLLVVKLLVFKPFSL